MDIIYFDTNALLGIYSYSLDTIKEIISSLEKMENNGYKIIISPTVYQEYERHYHKSRSRTGDNYPLSVFRNNFNEQKNLILGRLNKIQNIELSKIFETTIDKTIEYYKTDTDTYLLEIEKELERLEKIECDDEINDGNDILYDFVEKHKQKELTLEEKLHMASLANIRFAQNIKPGLTDQKKSQEYPFQEYGDVFIWYEILNNTSSNQNVIFIENERKDDWWEEKNSEIIAHELKDEFLEMHPDSKISMISFDTFYSTHLENYMDNNNAKVEICKIRDRINDYLNSKELRDNFENDILEQITDSEVENYFMGKGWNGGNIFEVNDIEVLKVSIDQNKLSSCYDSYDGTIIIRSNAVAFISCNIAIEYDKESYPTYWKIKTKIEMDVMAIYDLILNQKIISSKFSEEEHKFLTYSIFEEEPLDTDYENSSFQTGTYGNCTKCSTPINDDNYGDGTLCYHCQISEVDN